MAYQGIGTGTTPNDNSGDSLLTGAVKINSNFEEIYNTLGDGSNLLGGYIPVGGIIMWSGSIISIPSGWALCNGSNGTPNLQDRFIVGAGSGYSVGATGGADSVTLTVNEMPAHSHTGSTSGAGSHSHTGSTNGAGAHSHSTTFPYAYDLGSTGRAGGGANSVQNWSVSQSINGVGDHAHSFTTSGVGDHTHSVTVGNTGGGQAHENRPPYYALAFIMRTA
jgi:microcystin-dependent protein